MCARVLGALNYGTAKAVNGPDAVYCVRVILGSTSPLPLPSAMLPLALALLIITVRAGWTDILFTSNAWNLYGNITRASSAPGCSGGGLVANIFSTIELSFVGTAVALYGMSPNGKMSVFIDGASKPSSYNWPTGMCTIVLGYSELDPHVRHVLTVSTVDRSSGPNDPTQIIINHASVFTPDNGPEVSISTSTSTAPKSPSTSLPSGTASTATFRSLTSSPLSSMSNSTSTLSTTSSTPLLPDSFLPAPESSSLPPTSTTAPASSKPHTLSKNVIIAIAIGCSCFFVAGVLALFLWWRGRQRRHRLEYEGQPRAYVPPLLHARQPSAARYVALRDQRSEKIRAVFPKET